MSDELLELASECETASGPVLKLDERVLKAIGGKKRSDDWWLGYAYIGRVIPAYTKSVDAAMTLVPEGWNWGANLRAHQDDAQAWAENGKSAFVGTGFRPNPERQWYDTVAATPALALTAAALRARASRLRMEVE